MRRIVDAFAEYERQIIRARTRAALGAKAARGERVGEVPLGARVAADGRHLEADPREREALATIRRLRESGLSIRRIADELNRAGVPARGKRWHPTTVARVLAREAA
jgi:DNA invertase Pin-like site-specific DNA recombinase